MSNVYVRFEHGQEDRVSDPFGPFPFVQLTYNGLRVGPEGDHFAIYQDRDGRWMTINSDGSIAKPGWSDVVIYAEEAEG